jgi:hypothetical protein
MSTAGGVVGSRRRGFSSTTLSSSSSGFAHLCAPPTNPAAFAPALFALASPLIVFVANILIDSDDLLPGYLYVGTMFAGFLIGNKLKNNGQLVYEAALADYEREWVCKTCARRFVPSPDSLKK